MYLKNLSLSVMFILFCYSIFANSLEETDEIDIEIKKYIESLEGKIDIDEKKLNQIFGPPIQLKQRNEKNNKKNIIEFHNISEKEFNRKIKEIYKKKKIIMYQVKEGDTLFSIAKKYGMNLRDLYILNPQYKKAPLYIGDHIKVYGITNQPYSKYTQWKRRKVVKYKYKKYKVKKGDTLIRIAKKFKISLKKLIQFNRLQSKEFIYPGQALVIYKYKIIEEFKVRKLFIKPVDGYITSSFGYRRNPFIRTQRHFHKGIDIGAEIGTPIKAARDGLVIYSGRMKGFGNCIFIRHQGGYITVYGHNKVNLVKVGDIVRQGEMIAKVGRTGYATGSHLHFEVRKLDKPLNPLYALKLEEKIQLSIRRIALK